MCFVLSCAKNVINTSVEISIIKVFGNNLMLMFVFPSLPQTNKFHLKKSCFYSKAEIIRLHIPRCSCVWRAWWGSWGPDSRGGRCSGTGHTAAAVDTHGQHTCSVCNTTGLYLQLLPLNVKQLRKLINVMKPIVHYFVLSLSLSA